MPNVRLKVIPESETKNRAVLVKDPKDTTPFFRGEGGSKGMTDLVCGSCGHKLARRIQSSTQVQTVVLKCPICNAFNDTGMPTN